MQTLYADYSTTQFTEEKKHASSRRRGKDYMERSRKRSPYDDPAAIIAAKEAEDTHIDLGFILLTALFLLVLFPVGLVMLWMRRIRINGAAKMIVSVLSAALFCFVVILALNFETENPRLKNAQDTVRGGLEWVYDRTADTTKVITDWCGEKLSVVTDSGEAVWNGVSDALAHKVLDLDAQYGGNIRAVRDELPKMLLAKFEEFIGYEAPNDDPGLTENDILQPQRVPMAIVTPTPAPTAIPTPTPVPTATPAPIKLPEIKDVSEAPVYYTKGGKYYHMIENCSGMMNAVSHTLKEAQTDGKKVCEKCEVVAYSMMDSEFYLWVDKLNVAHTTDECTKFAGDRYRVLPFEDVYEGSFTYCPICNATTCLDYMRQNDDRFNVAYENLTEDMKSLYDYEKTVKVYYGENSRSYHANTDCAHMKDAKYEHTLYQALHVDGKQRCALCMPMTEEQAMNEFEKQR